MLVRLSIRDVVLIDKLDLAFVPGLSVLTGETGAGKSILLDSLSLALGARADTGLIRAGTDSLQVTAAFEVAADHPVRQMLDDAGITVDPGEDILLRRTLAAEGRSRAFINDQPVSVGLLRQSGDALVEIHGQFESHALLDPARHLAVLDAWAGADAARAACSAAHAALEDARQRREEAEASQANAESEEAALRAAVEEFAALAPEIGEEARLAGQRQTLMHGEQVRAALSEARSLLEERPDTAGALAAATRALTRIAETAPDTVTPLIEALDRAAIEVSETTAGLDTAIAGIDLDPATLERLEERLFALRALARKHRIACDDLPALQADLIRRLTGLEDGSAGLDRLRAAETEARSAYLRAARALSALRSAAAADLEKAVAAELPPLKLDRADFRVRIEPLAEPQWTARGLDKVTFLAATNPGAAPAPLHKVASGGELSRFMLALKVVLARANPVPTLIFDEVDSGIGGATAAAVGDRLARLGREVQVLVVTHSPQVAARGSAHLKVDKSGQAGLPSTSVIALDPPARTDEVARMLAGATVTEAARHAAEQLIAEGQ